MDTTGSGRWTAKVAAVLGGVVVVSSFFAAQNAVGTLVRGEEVEWLRVGGSELYYWLLLAFFLPVILWLARRLRFRPGSLTWTIPAHAAAAVAVGLVHSTLYYLPLVAALAPGTPLVPAVARQLPTAVMTVFWKYWVVVGVYYAFDYHRKYRERQSRAAELERSLTEARLHALRMQLDPHFLFNTLHTVSMLNLEDPDAANRVLARLSDLLRTALDTREVQEVTLADELAFVQGYLDIERARFEDRLQAEVEVPEDLLGACVPNLLLQPLVENAVRHGLEPGGGPGTIRVTGRREGTTLRLSVCDDGAGLRGGASPPSREGVGLENVRARLRGLYGEAGRLSLQSSSAGGVFAVVELPFRRGPCGSESATGGEAR